MIERNNASFNRRMALEQEPSHRTGRAYFTGAVVMIVLILVVIFA